MAAAAAKAAAAADEPLSTRVHLQLSAWLRECIQRHEREAESAALTAVERQLRPLEFTTRALLRACESLQLPPGQTLLDTPLHVVVRHVASCRADCLSYADVATLTAAWSTYQEVAQRDEAQRAYFQRNSHADSAFTQRFFECVTLFNMFRVVPDGVFGGPIGGTNEDDQLQVFWSMRAQLGDRDGGASSARPELESRATKRRRLDTELEAARVEQSRLRDTEVTRARQLRALSDAFDRHWRARREHIHTAQVMSRKRRIIRAFTDVLDAQLPQLKVALQELARDTGIVLEAAPFATSLRTAKLATLRRFDAFLDSCGEMRAPVGTILRDVRTFVDNEEKRIAESRREYDRIEIGSLTQVQPCIRALQRVTSIGFRRQWFARFVGLVGTFKAQLGALFHVPSGFDAPFTRTVDLTERLYRVMADDHARLCREVTELVAKAASPDIVNAESTYHRLLVEIQKEATQRDVDDFASYVCFCVRRALRASVCDIAVLRDELGALRRRVSGSTGDDEEEEQLELPSFDASNQAVVQLQRRAIEQLQLARTGCDTLRRLVVQLVEICDASRSDWAARALDAQDKWNQFSRVFALDAGSYTIPDGHVGEGAIASLRALMRTTNYRPVLAVYTDALVSRVSAGASAEADYRVKINSVTRVLGMSAPTETQQQQLSFVDVLTGVENLMILARAVEVKSQIGIEPYLPKGINDKRAADADADAAGDVDDTQ